MTLFNYISIRVCPRQGLLQDLKDKIDYWNREGYLILLMGDFNEYILIHRSSLFFSKLGLRELINDKHGFKGPGTTRYHKKNNAIYGIWGSPGLSTTNYGYLSFQHCLKYDHRLIWIKTSLSTAQGDKMFP